MASISNPIFNAARALKEMTRDLASDLGVDTLDQYYKLGLLGEGGYGQVNLHQHKDTFDYVAIKKVSTERVKDMQQLSYVRQEAQSMVRCRHCPFVLNLINLFSRGSWLYFIMDYHTNNTLSYWVRVNNGFRLPVIRFYAAELVEALDYLRDGGIVHRDLKGSNVLFTFTWHAVIADFGLSKNIKEVDPAETRCVGTDAYMPPEMWDYEDTTYSNDLWTLGCMIYVMQCNCRPFSPWDNTGDTTRLRSQARRGYFNKGPLRGADGALVNLINQLLRANPHHRLGARDIQDLKDHAFFTDIDFYSLLTTSPPSFQVGQPNVQWINPHLQNLTLPHLMPATAPPLPDRAPPALTRADTSTYSSSTTFLDDVYGTDRTWSTSGTLTWNDDPSSLTPIPNLSVTETASFQHDTDPAWPSDHTAETLTANRCDLCQPGRPCPDHTGEIRPLDDVDYPGSPSDQPRSADGDVCILCFLNIDCPDHPAPIVIPLHRQYSDSYSNS